jgi:hypothetical protein
MNTGDIQRIVPECVHRSDMCKSDVSEVDVKGSKHFLCSRCQTVLREKISKADSDGMPDWWIDAIIYKFIGRVNIAEINDTTFLPGY